MPKEELYPAPAATDLFILLAISNQKEFVVGEFHVTYCPDTGETCYSYREYLASKHWQQVKERYRNSKLPQYCGVCKSTSNLNLHHKTYKRLGKEHLTDLIYLCENCHRKTHKLLDTKRSKKLTLWTSAKRLRKKHDRKVRYEKNNLPKVTVYIFGNNKIGAWAARCVDAKGNVVFDIRGKFGHVSSAMGEVTPLLKALEFITEPRDILFYTNSWNVVHGVNNRLHITNAKNIPPAGKQLTTVKEMWMKFFSLMGWHHLAIKNIREADEYHQRQYELVIERAKAAEWDEPPIAPVCPTCEATMILRLATKGPNAGGRFWGCSNYPACRKTVNYSE